MEVSTSPAPDLEDAVLCAEQAAAESRVDIGAVRDAEGAQAVAQLFADVWRTGPEQAPVAPELIRGLAHTGSYVAAAYDDGSLVAASLAFRTAYGLHSHISGVVDGARDRKIGFALKQHQRAWALSVQLPLVTWTFDPLVRRNAWFNFTKLGAVGEEYLADFYGVMNGVNAGDLSDRILARWDLASSRSADAARGMPQVYDEQDLRRKGAVTALDEGVDGEPVIHGVTPAELVLARIPADIVSLRLERPGVARSWRLALRETLQPALAGDHELKGITRSGFYVLGASRSTQEEGPR